MEERKLLIASTSTLHGSPYLEYLKDDILEFFSGVKTLVFIPYARPGGMDLDEYTNVARGFFSKLDIAVTGVHEQGDIKKTLSDAEAIFTGGGNTFVLLKTLYDKGLMKILQHKVASGTPYMGTSAGSNLLGQTIQTTNDMPIVYPPTFDAIAAVPFNINPHYLDPISDSKHMGETRETRINEFHSQNDLPVVGLREGSSFLVQKNSIKLLGNLSARIFKKDQAPYELNPESDFTFLL